MPLLQSDTALVTGAAQGIGQAIARALGPHGIRVNAIAPGAYMSGSTVVVDGGLALYNWLEAST